MFHRAGWALILFLSPALWALGNQTAIQMEKEQVDAPSSPPVKKWKGTFNSFYFQFYGAKGAIDDLYAFGDLSLALQLLSLEYVSRPNWKWSVTGQFLDNQAELKIDGVTYADRTTGPGDTLISVTHTFVARENLLVFGDAGVSLPTGAFNMANKYVPQIHYIYPMQLGTGTVDPTLGFTPIMTSGPVQWGSRVATTFRLYDNSLGYHLGNQYKADTWIDWNLRGALNGLIPRLTGSYTWKDPIHGADPTIPRDRWTEVFYHPQISWNIAAALKYQVSLSSTAILSSELGVPFLQGAQNSETMWIKTRLYANVMVRGSF